MGMVLGRFRGAWVAGRRIDDVESFTRVTGCGAWGVVFDDVWGLTALKILARVWQLTWSDCGVEDLTRRARHRLEHYES